MTNATVAIVTLAAVLTASRAESAVPPPTTVIHAIAGQGQIAVSWNPVPGIIYYQLWVVDSVGVKVYNLFTPATAGCPSGTGACSVFATVSIVPGPFQVKVASQNADGWSDWSPAYDAMSEASMPRVLDQNNKFVGTLVDPQRIFFVLNGRVTETPIIKHRIYLLNNPGLVLYAALNCGGFRYATAVIPDRLVFNSFLTSGWLIGGNVSQITVMSTATIDPVTNTAIGCTNLAAMDQYSETVQRLTQMDGTPLFGALVYPLKAVP